MSWAEPGQHRAVDIPALTGLRAVAATWVVLHHFREALLGLLPALRPVEPLLNQGYLGVEVFFALSGFIISHNYANRLSADGSLRDYLWARVARIYPVHLVTLLVMAALVVAAGARGMALTSEARNTPLNFVGNLLMVQALPGLRPFNWPAWSVCCEMAAYLVFPLVAASLLRLRRPQAGVLAAAAAAVGVAGVWGLGAVGDSWSLSYPMMWWRITFGFGTGCLLWAWWRWGVTPGARWDAAAAAAVLAAVAWLWAAPTDSPQAFTVSPLLAVLVLCCASCAGPVARVLTSRLMMWGGRVSYSLYMTHFIVLLVVKKLAWWDRFAAAPLPVRLAVLVGYLLAVTAAAAGTYYAVEEPGRRALRRVVGRRAAQR
jgi:peptidoglycan/LPS O-acetylase OafA/YrhL